MAKQQTRPGAVQAAAVQATAAVVKPDEAATAATDANTALVPAETQEVAVATVPAAPPPAARDWRDEVRQLATFLQQAADVAAAPATPPTYFVLDVPTTGEPHCYRFGTHAGLIRFLRALEVKRAQLERSVYVFAGERIQITNAPRHLMLDGARIALFAAVEELAAHDDTLSPEDEEQPAESDS